MKPFAISLAILCAVLWLIVAIQVFALTPAIEAVKPTKIRVIAVGEKTITMDFKAQGETVEVEQFRSGKWVTLTPPVIKGITEPPGPNGCYEITAPTRKGSANQTRLCANGAGKRLCATEGVYVQR